jgi:ferredoxin
MPHVVTDNCTGCRFTDCVTTCPVSCFHGDDERLYIDPDACIDCGACIPACPVEAISELIDIQPSQEKWIHINAERAQALPVISFKQPQLASAEGRRLELGL